MKFTIKRLLLSTLLLSLALSSVLSRLSRKHRATEEQQVANKPKAIGKVSSNEKKVCCQVTYKNGKVSPKNKLSNFKWFTILKFCTPTKDSDRKKLNLSEEACKKQKNYWTKQIKKTKAL